jgi:penicillin-binding protein 1C
MPSFQEAKDSYKKSDAVLLDRHGKVIHELRIDHRGRRLEWMSLKDISPALIIAVIHSEDKRFYKHNGVDFLAVGSAAFKNIFAGSQRGASTITMQLAAVLNKKLKPKNSKRTLSEKFEQIRAARGIEKDWTKQEILEAYLNLITFRGELQGIASASRGLFGKEPHGLNDMEALILASLIRAPNASIDDVAERSCLLGNAMEKQTDWAIIAAKTKEALSKPPVIRQQIALAPHVARRLLTKVASPLARNDGEVKVISTIDGKLQRFTAEVLRQQLLSLKAQNVNDGAILIVENKGGDVLAYIGSSGEMSDAPFVDGVTAKRQAGSTLKPFLYSLAIEKRLLTAASLIDDSPLDIPVAGGVYQPRNYDSQFHGPVALRTALASSLNIPAVRTLQLVGTESFVQRLKELGFNNFNESGDYYGPSLALGSADVSLLELVNAYRTLANEGVWSRVRLTFDRASRTTKKRIFSREAAFIISDILSDRESRSATFDLENPLATRFRSAVKTGTSKDMRDNWCIGYSQDYTVGVWVGNFPGEPMWNVSGISGAAPIWLEIMNYLHHNKPIKLPSPPLRVVSKKIAFTHEPEDQKAEWFIRGTELDSIKQVPYIIENKITYPVEGTMFALDPDIPNEYQRIPFESRDSNSNAKWVLNGIVLGSAKERFLWSPKKGRYVLSLADEKNRNIDSIHFEVRGAGWQ